MNRPSICALISYLSFCSQASGQIGVITTVAGSGIHGYSGDGGPAASAELNLSPGFFSTGGVAVDTSGNLFIADGNRIRKVSAGGTIATVAGNGIQGYSGDGGPATSASLSLPAGLAVDASGNLFIADSYNNRVRRVSTNGVITTVAGGGSSGDGGPATSAELNVPSGVAVDGSGNLFIAETNNGRVRKVSASGIITTVAGTVNGNFTGDGGPATSAMLTLPWAVAVDGSGNLFIADFYNNRVRKVSASGIITTFAGSGTGGFSGDGGPATAASLHGPSAVAVDGSGNLFIADSTNNRVRKVSANGVIATVAGNGTGGFSGDGGPATLAEMYDPSGIAVDASGNLFIADFSNDRIREVSSPATVVSAATLAPGAAPDSLIAVLGSGLAASTARGTLDSNGQLPTTLAGTSVEINGQAAGLVFVSPSRINCVVPTKTTVGLATIAVVASGSQVASGTLSVATSAPGLFSADGSGTGVAVAVNSITAAGPPFPVQTQQNPTQISLFGTGMRYAGNPTFDPTITNVAGNIIVDAVDASGNPLSVQPTYVGLAPGFLGLDRVDLVLPAEAGSSGNMSIQIYAGNVGSNNLLVPILQSAAPALTSVQPATVAPGANLVIDGTSFVAEDPTQSAVRNSVSLLLPSGSQILLPVTQTAATELTAIVLPLQADGSWYQGPAQVCVSVDNQQTCSSFSIQITALNMLTTIPGAALLALQQQSAAAAAAYFTAAGLPAAAAAIQVGAPTDYSNLQAYIAAAVSNTPLTLQQLDGTTITVNPSLAVITTMEALLANSTATSSTSPAVSRSRLAAGSAQCASAGEIILEAQKAYFDFLQSSVKPATFVAAVATAAANPAVCANFSVTTCVATEIVELLVGTIGYGTLGADLWMQVNPYWLSGIEASPACSNGPGGCLTVPLNSKGTFSILGDFKPKLSLQNGVDSAALQLLNGLIVGGSRSSLSSFTIVEQAFANVIGEVEKEVVSQYAKFPPPASGVVQTALTSQSISVSPEQDLYAAIVLACGSALGSASGSQVTQVGGIDLAPTFYFDADNSNLLLFNNSFPETTLTVSVANQITVTPSDDYSSTGQQDAVPPSPKAYTLQNLLSSPVTYTVGVTYGTEAGVVQWLSVSPPSGNLAGLGSAVVTVSTAPVANSLDPGTYTGTITFASGTASITRNATLVITPIGACLNVSGSWNASESGSVTETVTAAGETDSETDPVTGSGVTTISQTGCSIQYEPIGESGLIGTNLTPSQLAMVLRSGAVSGNNVNVTGIVALVDTVAAAQNGLTIANVGSNLLTGTGQVVGNVMTLTETGNFAASGTYSISGQSGSFTLTLTTASTATFNRASGAPSTAAGSLELHVSPDNAGSSPTAIRAKIRAALKRAITLADR